jgi:hypothetical protein
MIIQYYSSVSVYWDIRSGCACHGVNFQFRLWAFGGGTVSEPEITFGHRTFSGKIIGCPTKK